MSCEKRMWGLEGNNISLTFIYGHYFSLAPALAEHVCLNHTRMHCCDENVRVFCRQELEEFGLRQLRANVRREPGQHCYRESAAAVGHSQDRGVGWVGGGEEGFCGCQRTFHVGLSRISIV